MAFFKFRKRGDDPAATPPQPESVEVLRRRARHRLIGAVVLVLAGVIGFPLLVDKQPRPIAVDIPIEIPDKNKVRPLGEAPLPASTSAASKPEAKPEPRTEAPVEAKVEPKPMTKPAETEAAKTSDKAVEKPAEKATEKAAEKAPADSGAKAQALLEGREPPKEPVKEPVKDAGKTTAAESGERFIVQVGAFADASKAREVRLKVERAGLKTYTHVIETKEGRRIRVRVGPFASRAEAEKAADKLKKLDLPAAILTL